MSPVFLADVGNGAHTFSDREVLDLWQNPMRSTPVPSATPTPTATPDFGVKEVTSQIDPDYLPDDPHPFLDLCPESGPTGPEHANAVSARFRSQTSPGGHHGWEVVFSATYRNDRTGETNVHTCQLNPATGTFMGCGDDLGHPANSGLLSLSAYNTDPALPCVDGQPLYNHYQMDLDYVRAYVEGGDTWRIVPLTGGPNIAGHDVAYTVFVQSSLTKHLGTMHMKDNCEIELLPCEDTVDWRFPLPGQTGDTERCLIWFWQPFP